VEMIIKDILNSLVGLTRLLADQVVGGYRNRLIEKMGLARREGEQQRLNG